MLEAISTDPLVTSLREVERANDPEFWSFQRSGVRRGAHALLHYPAMMVPDLQRTILMNIRQAAPDTKSILDPFVGSGTVLVEAMNQGLDFCGIDINPLAGLACLAKSGPYYVQSFTDKYQVLISKIRTDTKSHAPRDFLGRNKWFSDDVAAALEKICAHIRSESSLWARRLFWLALCRVVRASSNSRMSTYKLHKKAADAATSDANPIAHFEKTLIQFAQSLQYQRDFLRNSGTLARGRYKKKLEIEISSNTILESTSFKERQFDVIMTSPPYGDNCTTIPYGQFAYLPLNWIDIHDIQTGINPALLANTHATDSASLGGSLRHAKEKTEELIIVSNQAKLFLSEIEDNRNGAQRFGVFFHDFMKSVDRIASRTKAGGYQVWTTGNRRICGKVVPMDNLLSELLEKNNIEVLGKIRRNIHSKKMAKRNKSTETMTAETIVLGRKRPAD